MGLFSKTPQPNPKLSFEGIEFEYHRDHGWWEFRYRETDFTSFEPVLALPTKVELDAIVETLLALMPEMRSRLQIGLEKWGGAKLDDGESYSVDVKDFVRERTFGVSWSDGESWGDLGVDFVVKNGVIVDETWGD
jgi:hypothetical protein